MAHKVHPECRIILAFQKKCIFKHQQKWTVAVDNSRIAGMTTLLPTFINETVNTNDDSN
jgi:hypothetical protein